MFRLLIATLTVLAHVAHATPLDIEGRSGKQTIRFAQVAAGKKPSGAAALADAFAKYNWTVPTPLFHAASTAATPVQSGSVTATDLPNDRQYLCNVTLGKSVLLLNLDSGSSDLWGFSTLTPPAQRGGHHLYKLSGTKVQGETFDIEYVEGSGASGVIYADKVVVGKVTATVEAIGAATSVSSRFTQGTQDGILGLGFRIGNTCSPNYCYTFMDQVTPSLPQPIFTSTLRHNKPGEYDFGYIDSSKYTGVIRYNSLIGNQGGAYWEFYVGGFSVGTGKKVVHQMDTIADTGTSLLITDQVVVNAYYAGVPGAAYSSTQGGVIFPCSSVSKLKSYSVYIAGFKHTMPAAYGVYAVIGDGTCYGGIQSNNGNGLTILGDVFLKSQYVVFDVHTPRIGFAQQAGI